MDINIIMIVYVFMRVLEFINNSQFYKMIKMNINGVFSNVDCAFFPMYALVSFVILELFPIGGIWFICECVCVVLDFYFFSNNCV